MADYQRFVCEECGESTYLNWMPATRTDPGCYDADLECQHCGASLDSIEGEPDDGPEPDYERD
jgi:hypothetical protein